MPSLAARSQALLQKAFDRVAELPQEEQDKFARFLLAELSSERRWTELLNRSESEDLLEPLQLCASTPKRGGSLLASSLRHMNPDSPRQSGEPSCFYGEAQIAKAADGRINVPQKLFFDGSRRSVVANGMPPTRAYVLAYQIDLYIREHAAIPTISLKEVSRHFNITERYAMKLFQKHIECTFRTRLAYHRVELAKALIAQTDTPLGLIAEECGFKTQSRLTDAFKKIEGITPKIFRRNIQKDGDNSCTRK